jgi:DNA polymerase III epsilon subunit-like protein
MSTFLVKAVSVENYYSAKFSKEKPAYMDCIVDADTPQKARELARQHLTRMGHKNIHHILGVESISTISSDDYDNIVDDSLPWWEANLVACDTETTGLDPKEGRIIELAFCNYDKESRKFLPTKNYLLNDGVPVSAKITEITGITQADIDGKPTFADIYDEINELFLSKPNTILIFHNRGFDVGFIKESIKRIGKGDDYFPPSVCSMELSINDLSLPKNKLVDVASFLEVEGENSHRATDDACLAGDVFMNLCRRNSFFTRKDCDINQFLTFFDNKINHI